VIPDGDMSTVLAYFSPAVVLDSSPAAAFPHVHSLHINVSYRQQQQSFKSVQNVRLNEHTYTAEYR